MIRAQELEQEVHRATEAIRRFFAVEGDLDEADLEKLHAQFVSCIETVNARLRQCDDLLRKGLRQESLQECERPYNVLDMVTELDISEGDAWADYVRQYGIPPQPSLLIDVAAELNEAYTQAQTLEQVMRSYRLHALARSPLAARLDVLRSIATRDPDNPIWREDIKTFEAARLRQVDPELKQRAAKKDIRGVAALKSELEDPGWLDQPSPSLVARVVETHQRLLVEDARNQLRRLVEPIDAAFSNFDVPAAEALRERWDQLAATANMTEDDELAVSVAQAFEWLDQEWQERDRQEGFAHALAELEAAFEDDAIMRSELERLLATAERFGEAIPERLIRRFDQRIRALEAAEQRRSRLIFTTIIAAILVVGATTAFVVRWQLRAREIVNFHQSLVVATESNDVKQLQNALQRYDEHTEASPYLAADARVQQARNALERKIDSAKDRARRFDGQLEEALAQAKGGTWEAIRAAERALDTAPKPVGEQEALQLAKARKVVTAVADKVQAEVDAAFREELEPLIKDVKALDIMSRAEVIRMLAKAAELRDDRPRVSGTAKEGAALASLIDKFQRRLNAMEKQSVMQTAAVAIQRAAGQQSEFEKAIDQYLKLQPSGSRPSDLKKTRESDITVISKIDAYNAVAKKWNGIQLSPNPDHKAVEALLAMLAADFNDFPGVNDVLQLQPYIASLQVREKARSERQRILATDSFKMDCFKLRGGRLIYFMDKPQFSEDAVGARYRVAELIDSKDPTKIKKGLTLVKTDELVPPPKKLDSPQKAFANQVEEIPDKRSYEFQACALLHYLLESVDMDPILQTQLLQAFVDKLSAGSSILKEHLEPLAKQIATSTDLSELNWLDTQDGEIEQTRTQLRNMLTGLRRSKNAPGALYNSRIQGDVEKYVMKPPKLATYRWIGALMKPEDSDGWTCQAGRSTGAAQGSLVVCGKKQTEGVEVHKIGELAGGKPKLQLSGALYEGRPVYLAENP